ncbi:MAG: hypothetical protein HYX79_01950, partial [Chloroflexi bacterium]|nr:hypothetical protein [Chloroflexota bacterium]
PEPDPAITDEIVASYEITRLCQHIEKHITGQDRISIEIYKIPSSKGTIYPIISIGRFPEYPFTCTKDYLSKSNGETILEAGQVYIRTEGARTLTVKAPAEWRQLIRECIKASQEIEAKRPTEEEGDQWESQFSTWVKNENDNAMSEMKAAGFTKGFFKFTIRVPYGLSQIDNPNLLEIARKSECHNTGWPIGVVMTKREYKPVPLADGIRAVINTGDEFDYWALNNLGHLFFIRSHQEDTKEAQEKTRGRRVLWFDVAIWRISEIITYTANLCSELNLKQSDEIQLILSYEGLKGRVLSVAKPLRLSGISGECTEDKYGEKLELHVADIMPKLKDHVYQIAIGLFGLFDFFKPDRVAVDSIVDEFLNARR